MEKIMKKLIVFFIGYLYSIYLLFSIGNKYTVVAALILAFGLLKIFLFLFSLVKSFRDVFLLKNIVTNLLYIKRKHHDKNRIAVVIHKLLLPKKEFKDFFSDNEEIPSEK